MVLHVKKDNGDDSVHGLFKIKITCFCYEYETHLQNYKCVLITSLVKSGVSVT